MSNVAICFLTCDRPELSRRSIEPLLAQDGWDLHWCDGSKTTEGKKLPDRFNFKWMHSNICGGSGPTIVYALTMMLERGYEFCGLCENDVLLDKDFFKPMMHLFKRGAEEGLEVGAVSARSYEDRILIQKQGYGIFHNLGAGQIMFTREAAELVLQNYRTVWTTENRLLFSQLSGVDIGRYWAFRGEQHFLVADWNFDRVLAAHGLASLALTPNRATMLDQNIAPLGLKYADGDFALARNPSGFERYRDNLARVREGKLRPGVNHPFFHDGSVYTIFAHQVPMLGGVYSGDWRARDFQGFGPFCWRATEAEVAEQSPIMRVPVIGPCDLIVSGGKQGGRINVADDQSGFNVDVDLAPETDQGQVMQLAVPGAAAYREIVLTARSPGVCFFGLRVKEPQPWLPGVRFDYGSLPPS